MMGGVPLRGGAGNQGSEFHYPVVGRRDRKTPAPGSPAPNRSRKHTTRIHPFQRGTLEEKEAVSKYRTPSEDSQKQSLDKELGIQDVTNINESWYPPTEAELALAIESIRDKSQPMDIDPALAEDSMPR